MVLATVLSDMTAEAEYATGRSLRGFGGRGGGFSRGGGGRFSRGGSCGFSRGGGDRAAGGFAVSHSSMTEGAGRRSSTKGFAAIKMMLFFVLERCRLQKLPPRPNHHA